MAWRFTASCRGDAARAECLTFKDFWRRAPLGLPALKE